MHHYLIAIVGPTAIGKTKMSLELAQALKTEIISADSRQFYKEMCIGTAVPTPEETSLVPHHFIQHRSVRDHYDVGDFEKDALKKLDSLFEKHQAVLMVGGSGLYVKAVCEGLSYFPEINPEIREELNRQFEEEGIEKLQQQIQELDPAYAQHVDLQNPRRLIRALEICIGSGKSYSHFLYQPKTPRSFIPLKIGLTAPRELIYKRIEQRVDQMVAEGLLEEVQRLFPLQRYPALNTIGYQELFTHLEGRCSLDFAISEIKKNTRRFAKRQLTWFKRDPTVHWFAHDTVPAAVITYIQERLK